MNTQTSEKVDCGPQPPIPVHIRKLLGNYPEYLQWLQRYLSDAVKKPLNEAGSGRAFSMAIWTLERALDMLLGHARSELRVAEARSDAEAILIAHNKESCMLLASIRNRWIVDEELSRFCWCLS